jgi:hypothetical protein
VQLQREAEAFRAGGAEVVLIGNGKPPDAKAFAKSLALTIPVFVDPSRTTYEALLFTRGGLLTTLRLPAFAHLVRALSGGFWQGWTKGDPWQLGGILVVKADGECAYRYASREPGDHPPLSDVRVFLGEPEC